MLSAELKKAEADNTYGDLDYLAGMSQMESSKYFIIHCFDKNKTNTPSQGT